jgi:hypothetical protein
VTEHFLMTGPDDPRSCQFLTSVKINGNYLHFVISSSNRPLHEHVIDASIPNILMKFMRADCKRVSPRLILCVRRKGGTCTMLLLTYFLSHRHRPTKRYSCMVSPNG